jgi:hypothetical protein
VRGLFRSLKLPALLIAATLNGCDEEESIRAYNAPKDPPTSVRAVAAASSTGPLTWKAPAEWKELPAGQMRVAAFAVSDTQPPVELTVIPLGPEAGELTPNINRWEGQLGLQPSPKAKIEQLVKKESINGLEVMLVDLSGSDKRMLAAIVPHGGRFWYFKMMGPTDVIAKQADNFHAFMHTVAPGATVAEQNQAPAPPPAPRAPSALKSFKAPQGWTEIPNSQPPRMLAFTIGDADPKTEMIATRFGGNNAGSFLDNINRWRGQLGLQPVADAREVQMSDAKIGKGAEAVMVELHNPGGDKTPAKRMIVAIASSGGDLWFFKMTGPAEVVDKQRTAFDEFLKSLEFDEGQAR